jgi:O-acetyl-ADP-ribose deacetylase (regulator of RNase III)
MRAKKLLDQLRDAHASVRSYRCPICTLPQYMVEAIDTFLADAHSPTTVQRVLRSEGLIITVPSIRHHQEHHLKKKGE